jgi:hypothetical protein
MDGMTEYGAPERKDIRVDAGLRVAEAEGAVAIEGYASRFGLRDQGGDVVAKGAYGAGLKRLEAAGGRVRMLWQHDPARPIGVWDEVREDGTGLYVKGRILTGVAQGREAAELLAAGAIDGLSIGYRTIRASRDEKGARLLHELELWEVSLVTFPMLPEARVAAKGDDPAAETWAKIAALLEQARQTLAGRSPAPKRS